MMHPPSAPVQAGDFSLLQEVTTWQSPDDPPSSSSSSDENITVPLTTAVVTTTTTDNDHPDVSPIGTPAEETRQPDQEKLSYFTKIVYGLPNGVTSFIVIFIKTWLNKYYSDTLGVPLYKLAQTTVVSTGLDTIISPAIGWASDRTWTPIGRRRPFIAVGVLISALSFIALFTAPFHSLFSVDMNVLWFGFFFMLYGLGRLLYNTPKQAFGAELSMNYQERSRLSAWAELFQQIGMIIAYAIPTAIGIFVLIMEQNSGGGGGKRKDTGSTAYYFWGSIIAGVLVVVLMELMVILLRERKDFSDRRKQLNALMGGLIPGIRRCFYNRAFIAFLFANFFLDIQFGFYASVTVYYLQYVVNPPAIYLTIPACFLVTAISSLMSIYIWKRLAIAIGKKRCMIAGMAFGTLTFPLFMLLPVQQYWYLVFIPMFCVGIVNGNVQMLVSAMVADIIDYDELLTSGTRREAQYFMVLSLFTNLVVVMTSTVPLFVMDFVGYTPNVTQSDTMILILKFMQGAVTGIACLLSAAAFGFFYPINKSIHTRIREAIRMRNQFKEQLCQSSDPQSHQRSTATVDQEPLITDPVTGEPLVSMLHPTTLSTRLIESSSEPVPTSDDLHQNGQQPPPPAQSYNHKPWFLYNFSRGELKRAANLGYWFLAVEVIGSFVVSVLITLASVAALVAFNVIPAISNSQHVSFKALSALATQIACYGLAVSVFHALRLPPLYRMLTRPVPPELIVAHLRRFIISPID